MARTPTFPNLSQALLLIGVYWLAMSAPLEFIERVGIASHPYLAIATVLIVSPLCALALLWTGYRITRAPLSEVYPLGGFPALSALAVVAATVGVWVLIDSARGAATVNALRLASGRFSLLRFLVPVLYAPVIEESLHRGLILRGLLSRYPKHIAILFSAALFGLVHAGLGFGSMISALCFGLIVGQIYVATRSLLPGLLVHSASNAMFTLSPRTGAGWAQTAWYPSLGFLLALAGIGWLLRTRMVRIQDSKTHFANGMLAISRAEKETGEAAICLLQEASLEFAAAAALAPESAATLVNWGAALTRHAHQASGEAQDRLFAEACERYAQAAEIAGSPEALHNWGGALLLHAESKTAAERDRLRTQACARFEQAVAIAPRAHATLTLWASALGDRAGSMTGDGADRLFDQAREKFAAAAAIEPDSEAAFRRWGSLLLHHADRKAGEEARELWSEAQRRLEEAIRIEPRNPDTRRDCAAALLRIAGHDHGDHAVALAKRAQEHCAAALEVEPESAFTLDTWGVALLIEAEKTAPRETHEAPNLRNRAKSKFLEAEALQPGISAYNLACLCALQEEEELCREWLLKAEPGVAMTHAKLIADRDLHSVRERPWFQEIVSRCQLSTSGNSG